MTVRGFEITKGFWRDFKESNYNSNLFQLIYTMFNILFAEIDGNL